ncbi:hypothetical protein Asi03nite_34220 [Actinoplanes siamensis]|uniref:Uncharacterized protein n=1 Tax=Actinoplanes siamensis TaxID=1223317 RepID=A0A919N7H1_9ACTN|nr:hypothetical protein Asi03nite_34220 [Actinoplanes siamensis]
MVSRTGVTSGRSDRPEAPQGEGNQGRNQEAAYDAGGEGEQGRNQEAAYDAGGER